MPSPVRADELALVRGLGPTRATLVRWNRAPWRVLRGWLAASAAVALALLAAVWVVATVVVPDPTPLAFPGLNRPSSAQAVFDLLGRNALVLALHAMACVAGYIAYTSLPAEATRYSGAWRWIHDHAGPVAIAFVAAATLFSLATQAFALGLAAGRLAFQLDLSPVTLLLGVAPHALPELIALFLPLAAWLLASRRREWDTLLAATAVTVAIAIPVLIVSALVEVYVSGHLLQALAA
jgi:stage II sporulation SpoM-like protein